MIELTYKRLSTISTREKPYRGSTNRFPIEGRRANNKYFLVDKEGDETIFRIIYGEYYFKEEITMAEYVKEYKSKPNSVYGEMREGKYYRHARKPNQVGIVRSDNTFEFTADAYHLGERTFLSNMSRGYFNNDSRRGGMVFKQQRYSRTEPKFYPIYQGMRINCETMEPTKRISITGKTVNRKESKRLMANHKDFFTTAEVMCKSISQDAWIETAKTIFLENELDTKKPKEILSLAEAAKDTAPLDSIILYALAMNISDFRFKIKHPSSWTFHPKPIDLFNSAKSKIIKQIYMENKSTFNTVSYECNEKYPPSEWGYTLTVDGVEVKQYGYGVYK